MSSEGINQDTIAIRNVVSAVMKDINVEIRSLSKLLPDITPEERRRRLLFWTVRSRQHVENLKSMCKWILKHQPTIDAINLVYKRINVQRTLIDKCATGFELTSSRNWQNWSRMPDISAAMSVLSRGSYPHLPNKIFNIGEGESSINDSTSEYVQLKYERVVQRQLISEKVPVGGRLSCTFGGLTELLCPSFFVAFLILKNNNSKNKHEATSNDTHANISFIWEVRGVEVLMNGGLDLSRSGLPSEKDLEKLTLCANDVAYLPADSLVSSSTTAIERIYYCLATLISTIALRVLESQALSLMKSRQMGLLRIDMDSEERVLRIWFWVSTATTESSFSKPRSKDKNPPGAPLIEIRGTKGLPMNSSANTPSPMLACLVFGFDRTKHQLKLNTSDLDVSSLLLQAYQLCIVTRLRAISNVFQTCHKALISKLLVKSGILHIKECADSLDATNNDKVLSTAKIEFTVFGKCCCLISIDVKSGSVFSCSSHPNTNPSIQKAFSRLNSALQSLCLVHSVEVPFSDQVSSLLLDIIRIGTIESLNLDVPEVSKDQSINQLYHLKLPFFQSDGVFVVMNPSATIQTNESRNQYMFEVGCKMNATKPVYSIVSFSQQMTSNSLSARKNSLMTQVHRVVIPDSRRFPMLTMMKERKTEKRKLFDVLESPQGDDECGRSKSSEMGLENSCCMLQQRLFHAVETARRVLPVLMLGEELDLVWKFYHQEHQQSSWLDGLDSLVAGMDIGSSNERLCLKIPADFLDSTSIDAVNVMTIPFDDHAGVFIRCSILVKPSLRDQVFDVVEEREFKLLFGGCLKMSFSENNLLSIMFVKMDLACAVKLMYDQISSHLPRLLSTDSIATSEDVLSGLIQELSSSYVV